MWNLWRFRFGVVATVYVFLFVSVCVLEVGVLCFVDY